MSRLPLRADVSAAYPNPSNATARVGFGKMFDVLNEITESPEIDLASAATCEIGAQVSTKLCITGTTGISSFGTTYRGPILLRFAGAVTLTHNATTLRCPGSANMITAAGDLLMAWPTATVSGTLDGWQVVRLALGSNIVPIAGGGTAASTAATAFANLKQAGSTSATGVWESATDAEAQAGTDATRVVTPDNLGATVIGMGQTWQSLTGSRASSTTYTNSTGRAIMVSAGLVTSAVCSIIVTLSGITFTGSSYNASGGINTACFIVPPGGTYSVANNAGTSVVSSWAELR